jgi:hypothetical protein
LKSRCHVPLLFMSLLGCNGHLWRRNKYSAHSLLDYSSIYL